MGSRSFTAWKDVDAVLLFVHGWLGNSLWWDAQNDFFASRAIVARMDLPCHGSSDSVKGQLAPGIYTRAIKAVAIQIDADNIVLIGHSMAGPFVLEASASLPLVRGVVLVDTLKDLDKLMSLEQAERTLFDAYRKDLKHSVEQLLPRYLFAPTIPKDLVARLQSEFLAKRPETAIRAIRPLYECDIQKAARMATVPVRAINSDQTPTNHDTNRKYFRDFDCILIVGGGHYPMLELPSVFNQNLELILQGLGVPLNLHIAPVLPS